MIIYDYLSVDEIPFGQEMQSDLFTQRIHNSDRLQSSVTIGVRQIAHILFSHL